MRGENRRHRQAVGTGERGAEDHGFVGAAGAVCVGLQRDGRRIKTWPGTFCAKRLIDWTTSPRTDHAAFVEVDGSKPQRSGDPRRRGKAKDGGHFRLARRLTAPDDTTERALVAIDTQRRGDLAAASLCGTGSGLWALSILSGIGVCSILSGDPLVLALSPGWNSGVGTWTARDALAGTSVAADSCVAAR